MSVGGQWVILIKVPIQMYTYIRLPALKCNSLCKVEHICA